jgi:hypothetical protein
MDLNIGTKDPVNKILWDEELAIKGGSFTLAADIPSSNSTGWVLKGLPLSVNETSRIAEVVKTATAIVGSTTTGTRVEKTNLFIVGDVIAKVVGGNGVAITSIDKTNADYDILVHLTNGGAAVAGDIIFEAAAVGTGDAAYLFSANALLNDNTKMVGSATITAVIGALDIIEANLPAPISAAMKTALTSRYKFV